MFESEVGTTKYTKGKAVKNELIIEQCKSFVCSVGLPPTQDWQQGIRW
jgi:hypothetical protein